MKDLRTNFLDHVKKGLNGKPLFLRIIFWGILQMEHLHIAPQYPEAVMAYVRACQPVNGGFGRRAGAIATLEGTFHAVMIAAGLSRNPLLQMLTGISMSEDVLH